MLHDYLQKEGIIMKRLYLRYAAIIFGLLGNHIFYASHSFFMPRQITMDPTFELALTDYFMFNADSDNDFQFYVKPFIQRSTKKSMIASYFLPNNKPCATVREQGTGDIDPLWFNVMSPNGSYYSSTLFLKPQRTTYGAVITLYADLHCITEGLWLLINTTAMDAIHAVDACESNITGTIIGNVGSGTIAGFANMCDGLNNPTWLYGKIPCCGTKKKAGLDDIQVKIGYSIDCIDNGHIAPYLVGTIPTGNGAHSRYLFEPMVGSKHGSLGFGLNGEYDVREKHHAWKETDHALTFLADLKYRYVFTANERRSFDLCQNGNWSRYLLVVTEDQLSNSLPAINYFTLPCKVTPRSTIDFWLAMHYNHCAWDVEIGYTLWWRQQEKIKLRCCNSSPLANDNIGIYDMTGVANQSALSASTATIAQSVANGSALSDTVFTPVTLSQLNLLSAEHPNALSNKIYASGSWRYDCPSLSLFLGLNSSYEIASSKNALNQWAVWANIGLDF
jgi:hypothetical protein